MDGYPAESSGREPEIVDRAAVSRARAEDEWRGLARATEETGVRRVEPRRPSAAAPTRRRSTLRRRLALDRNRRMAALDRHLRGIATAPDIELPRLATIVRGLTGAEIGELLARAGERAAERGEPLAEADVVRALRDLEARHGRVLRIRGTELRRLAYHEAGRVLVQALQDAPPAAQVSIFPGSRGRRSRLGSGGNARELFGEARRRAHIIGLLAGQAAGELGLGEHEWHAEDVQEARAAVRQLLGRWNAAGASRYGSLVPRLDPGAPVGDLRFTTPPDGRDDGTLPGDHPEHSRVLDECFARALELLRAHEGHLHLLADAFAAEETLSPARVREILAAPSVQPDRVSGPVPEAPAPEVVHAAAPASEIIHTSVPALTRAGVVRHRALAGLWLLVNVSFWSWWLGRAGTGSPGLYWAQTLTLFYQVTVLPTIYWVFVGRMRRPVEPEAPPGMKVALITLCVPKHESLDLIRAQLDVLTAVDYPHDSWILDEGASADVRALAEERGVRYFTRREVALWNQPHPPFQVATKAGNVNAWLDHVASLGLGYDVFVQFDIDHHPRRDYLDRVLGYFRDPQVAYVQAPSVCGNVENWAARGLAEQDLVFQGPLQMGFYGSSRTPFIIGSHTSYRMSAVREIGGYQPTRAEDHLDTVVLAARGYEGVYVPELIAIGDGPHDLATYLRQQFAWAYSMIQIFLHHTPRLVRRYSLRQAFQFLFCQSWYTLYATSLAVLWAIPMLAVLLGEQIADVRLSRFLEAFLPVVLASSVMWCETRRFFQPRRVRLSWRGVLLTVARWPVVLWALVNVVLRIRRPYMITPKGGSHSYPEPTALYGPTLVMALLPLAAIVYRRPGVGSPTVHGLYGLALANVAMMLCVTIVALGVEVRTIWREAGPWLALRLRGSWIVLAALSITLFVTTTMLVWDAMLRGIS